VARFSTSTVKLVLSAVRTVQPVTGEARPLVFCGRGEPLDAIRR
jgi:hypothetical protein